MYPAYDACLPNSFYATSSGLAQSCASYMQSQATIRNSNTIFSTMVCPMCGERLVFYKNTDGLTALCPKHSDWKTKISLDGMIALLNNNGLNWLVTPAKRSECIKDSKKCEDVPPPDGLKFEPPEDNDG